MKIMHIIDSDGIYGAEVMLLNLMEEQEKMKLMPLLLNISDMHSGENELGQEARERGMNIVNFKMKRGYSLSAALDMLRLATMSEVTLIHSHGYKGNILLGSLPKTIRKIPMVRTIHGWTSKKRFTKIWLYEKLDKMTLRNMDAVVKVSLTAGPVTTGTNGSQEYIIENGIPEHYFDPEQAVKKDPVVGGFCSEGYVIGTISRLSEEKGLLNLIEAMRLLLKENGDYRLIIIGDGPQKESLQMLIDKAGLSGKILLTGYRNAAYHYLPLFKVFVLPSLTEGLPITILEAMQAEVPIAASGVGGIPEVLGHGESGILLEPGMPGAIADAIAYLRSHPQEADMMRKKARAVARERYSSRRMAEDYLRVYESIIKGLIIE
jgi:glycosyltransferase involved in cell wall biosynthesis